MTTPTKAPAPGELTPDEIAAERTRLGIPDATEDDGNALRSWIRYRLQRTKKSDTGKPWTQADIARAAYASETSVSIVFKGGRIEGRKGEKIRLLTAEVLGIDARVLFPKLRGDT